MQNIFYQSDATALSNSTRADREVGPFIFIVLLKLILFAKAIDNGLEMLYNGYRKAKSCQETQFR